MDKVALKLTKDELEEISIALNYYNVEFYHKKMDQAQRRCDDFDYKFYERKWLENVDLFLKVNQMKKEA